ncbi:MAG: shikimate kinase [Patescibacteria group bacterium]|nr:shikimate kinase [Patescibacteria group bacterium]
MFLKKARLEHYLIIKMKNIHNAITLIGMPTSGKSTIGKLVADKLGWDFTDLDDLIKEKTGKSYDEILEQGGEKELLDMENRFTLELDFGKGLIFSPGGSLIYSVEAMEKAARETKIIYIELPLKEIEIRLGLRPIKGGIVGLKEKGLKKLFEERDVAYRKFADYIIKADNLSEEELVIKVLELINQ